MSDKFFSKIGNIATAIISLIFIGALVITIGVFYLVFHFSKDLPDYSQLEKYSPPTVTRLYAADGRMIEEYAKEKRLFVPVKAIPKKIIHAFIAAEDKNFYTNPGIDFGSIFRAAIQNVANLGRNKSLVGGSTITQQVVKNFLLTKEQSLTRKIKEAILSFRITQAFSKDKIMELYLNEIYLGNRSYGVAAAALNYFNKSIDELSIEEVAMLAALPKAPSSLDPHRFPKRAKERRDWVIGRMAEDGYISEVDAVLAASKPITLVDRDETETVNNAQFFAEAVRQELEALYGEEGVYERGLAVRTTLEPELQDAAEKALRSGLVEYDRRHGWRGPIAKVGTEEIQVNWKEKLDNVNDPDSLGGWMLAVVYELADEYARVGLKDGNTGKITLKDVAWARQYKGENELGPNIRKMSDVLANGDVIAVTKIQEAANDKGGNIYSLQQVPQINGGIVAIDPHNGRILAMSGGFYYGEGSKFNRAMQAKRQPGSAFKPFVYLAALENGFAPNSIIVDEEIQLDQGGDLPGWRPQNYSGEYYGPTTLRVGIEKSRNAMTVRLAQMMGIEKVVEVAKRFGINDHAVRNFSAALGSAETTLFDLTNAYAMLVNGGKSVRPSLIERIQNSDGRTIHKMDNRVCEACTVKISAMENPALEQPPSLVDERKQIADPITTYQIVSLLEGVVQRGTGQHLKELGRVLAGKTGTTNDSVDAWFMGFSADLAVGVYVGFDNPRSLGKFETGAAAALPVWKSFMETALHDKPDIPFRRPAGVKLVKIDAETGQLPTPDTPKSNIIYEAFRAGTEPTSSSVNNFAPAAGGSENGGSAVDLDAGGVY